LPKANAQTQATAILPFATNSGLLGTGIQYEVSIRSDGIGLTLQNQTGDHIILPHFWMGLYDARRSLRKVLDFFFTSIPNGEKGEAVKPLSDSFRPAFYKLIFEDRAVPDPIVQFRLTEPKGSIGLRVITQDFSISFSVEPEEVGFVLVNKTTAPMKMLWDESAYVDQRGRTHRVMHAGVKYIDRDKSMPPSLIPPGSSLEDIVFPVSYVYYSGGWRQRNLFDVYEAASFGIGVFLSLEVKGQKRGITFRFQGEPNLHPTVKAMFGP
jgi:hypothetical protein